MDERNQKGNQKGPLSTTIDGNDYTFSQAAWQALYRETDQWLGEYLADLSLEIPEDDRESAEIIPLFGIQATVNRHHELRRGV